MLKVLDRSKSKEWNEYVKSFQEWDIYYLFEYAESFSLHGDGEPFLIVFENNGERLCYVVMQNDIEKDPLFSGKITKRKYFDWETPYGYGGPLIDSPISQETQDLFLKELKEYCLCKGIVSQFIRFHPLLENYLALPNSIETRYLRDTIFIDTSEKNRIFQNMDSKNRNMVRKAQKNNVKIITKDIVEFDDFIPIYNETMKRNDATDYYTFNREYFVYLKNLGKNALIMYAIYNDVPISGSLFFYNDKYMHYHLSGSKTEYRQFSPSNLLLYEASLWANEHGIKMLHLGGGLSPDDSLFGFKKQFNKFGNKKFVVGRTIFCEKEYNELKRIRKEVDSSFDMDNSFFIQYRKQ